MNKTTAAIFAGVAAAAAFGATVPAPYISLDLAEGTFETLAARPSEWTFADYETRIVLGYGGKSAKGNPFYFSAFDTTVAQWAAVMGGTEDEMFDDSTKTGVTKREIRGILPDALFPITYGSFLARLREKAGVRGFELYDRDNPAGTQGGFRIEPCLPADRFPTYRVVRRFRDAEYDLTIHNTGRGGSQFIPYEPGKHKIKIEL